MRNKRTSLSGLAQLLQEIDRQNEAAYQGLHGLAYGASQHAFITAKMERIAVLKERLTPQIGEEAAIKIVMDVLEQEGACCNG
jgi:hypothetical protein